MKVTVIDSTVFIRLAIIPIYQYEPEISLICFSLNTHNQPIHVHFLLQFETL